MKGNYLYSCVMFLFITVSAQAQADRKVAVFDPVGTVEKALLEIVREEISSVVVNKAGYTVLERQLINTVLEENRFQESGLVDDEQVSNIGKRMGADYVFVTTISALGENFYISCKMIEVASARIDKQFTGTSTDGIKDIPQTTQYIVRRMFGENVQQQVYKQPQQTVRPAPNVVTQKNTNDTKLFAKKRKVYQNGQRLKEYEVFNLMANTDIFHGLGYKGIYMDGKKLKKSQIRSVVVNTNSDALKLYSEGIILHKNGNAWIIISPAGVIYFAGIGVPVGIIKKSRGNKLIREAVDKYNNSLKEAGLYSIGGYEYFYPHPSFEIYFDATSSGGIGSAMKF